MGESAVMAEGSPQHPPLWPRAGETAAISTLRPLPPGKRTALLVVGFIWVHLSISGSDAGGGRLWPCPVVAGAPGVRELCRRGPGCARSLSSVGLCAISQTPARLLPKTWVPRKDESGDPHFTASPAFDKVLAEKLDLFSYVLTPGTFIGGLKAKSMDFTYFLKIHLSLHLK